MSKSIDTKTMVNTLYDGAVISGLTVAYSMLASKLLTIPVESSKTATTVKKFSILVGVITLSVATKDALEKNNILPVDPYKDI